jgi:hypothetical protein
MLLTLGAMHSDSYGGDKSCLLLLDQSWCDCDGTRGGMRHVCLLVSPQEVTEF